MKTSMLRAVSLSALIACVGGGTARGDNLLVECTGAFAGADVWNVSATVPSDSDSDNDLDSGATLAQIAISASATDTSSAATASGTKSASVDVAPNSTSTSPQVNAAGLVTADGMGSSYFAAAAGDCGVGASFEVLSNGSATHGLAFVLLTGTVTVSGNGSGGPSCSAGPFSASASAGGGGSVGLSVDGVPIFEDTGTGYSFLVTFPVEVGGTISADAAGRRPI